MSLDERLIDKRVVARSIKQGRVDAEEYRQSLAALPDLSDHVAREDDSRGVSSRDDAAPRPSAEAEATGL